jgi:anti-anti-sigma regulatory factor
MGSKFHAEVHHREGVTYLKVSGVIDEDNDLQGLEGRLGTGTLIINLVEVDRINSCGVRDWVNWLGRVEKSGARPVLVECSPPIVSQVNLVHNFTGNGVVKSFYAPYFCPRCQKEKLLLLETRDMVQGGPPFQAPTCRCDECDGPMEFDDMEESYFAFLSNAKKVPTDPAVDAVVQEMGQAEGTGSGGSGSKLRPRGMTGQPSTATPQTPQPAAPAEKVAALPSVPVVVPVAHPPDSQAGPKSLSTAPGTPTALAQALAEAAQAERLRAIHDTRSPLQWGMLIALLLLAVGLLAWVFVT